MKYNPFETHTIIANFIVMVGAFDDYAAWVRDFFEIIFFQFIL